MICNNCRKKVVEGSEFCPYCGSKLSSDSETLGPINYKVYDVGQTNIKPKKRIGKGLIIVIICCIALIASAIYFTIIADNGNSKKSSSTDESIVQGNIENEIEEAEEIPEDKRATVTFIEETGNVIEDREIFDRDGLCAYLEKNNNKVRNDIANMNVSNAMQGGYIYNLLNSIGTLYYVEYTTKIGDLPETTSTDYGSIIFWDCAGTRGSTTNFEILATIWNPFSNASNDYFLAKEISNQTRGDFNQKVNNMVIPTIKDFYAEGRDYMDIRIGLIETKNNPWLYEYIKQQDNADTQTEEQNEVTNSSNVNTIIDNNTNINTSENDYQQDTSNNNNNSYSEANNSEDIDDTLEITSITLRNGINLSQAGNFTSRTENIALELEVGFNIGNDVKETDKNFSATINGEDVSISENSLDSMDPNIKFVKNDVTLKLGKNTFKVNVTNGKGVSASKTYTITFSPYKPKFYSTYTHGNVLYIEVRNEEYTTLDSSFTVTVNGKSTEKEHTSPEVERFSYVIEDGETEFKIVVTDKYGQSITKNYEI